MKLERWALVAEIVSAVTIVLSLLFVGLQVRLGAAETAANSRALEATVRESMLNADLSILQAALPYPSMLAPEAPADDEESHQKQLFSFMIGRTRENFWKQRENGMLDEETYLSYRETLLHALIESDFHLEIWNSTGLTLVPGFREEINEELRRRGRLPTSEPDAD